MIQSLCPRCRSVLHLEDHGTLVFCWNCGAPQITLSEELLDQAERQQQDAATVAQGGSTAQAPDAARVNWKAAIHLSLIVAGALSAISILVPPAEMLAWLAPSIVLALYASRNRQTRITAGLGARIGLLCGVLSSVGLMLITALQMLVLRFGIHGMAEVEANMNSVMLQAKTRAVEQSGQAAASIFDLFLSVPEFRAGFFLAGLAMVTAILLVLSTAGGAFAGFVRSKQTKSLV